VFGDVGGLAVGELNAIAQSNCGDDLRAAGEDWARAADLLDRRSDTIEAGLSTLEWVWDSPAGRAHADGVRALVVRMRATADVARYNHAQMLAAADVTDKAIRQLALVSESAERDIVARDIADALNETYANVAARLTGPLVGAGEVDSRFVAGQCGPQVLLSGTGPPAAGGVSLGVAVGLDPAVPPVSLSVSPEGQSRASTMDPSDNPSPGDDGPDFDIDPDLPDAVGAVPLPASRTDGTRGRGRGERFPATPRPAVAPVLPAVSPSTPAGSPVPPTSGAARRTAWSGTPSAASDAAPVAPRPTGASRRPAEQTYVDARGHDVRIRWRGDGRVEPHP
jgi:hypothetical protein